MSDSTLNREMLDLLRTFDTPTVCNVIELFDVRPDSSGYMDARIKACFPELPPIVAYASTATFRGAAPAPDGSRIALGRHVELLAEVPAPQVVVFQDLDDPPVAATFGEIMCATYQAFGAVGLITSGAGRDLDQVRALDFPVFTNGTICSHGYSHTPSFHEPVRVGGVTISPADLIHADRNGVTTIPPQIASELGHACAEFVRAEAVVLDYLQAKSITPKGLDAARTECRRMIERLREKITRGRIASE